MKQYKVSKTAVIVSGVLGLYTYFISQPFLYSDARWLGLLAFNLVNLTLWIKPELMGSLHKPDDGEKEEDT
mgnify:CR=1 FL=1